MSETAIVSLEFCILWVVCSDWFVRTSLFLCISVRVLHASTQIAAQEH